MGASSSASVTAVSSKSEAWALWWPRDRGAAAKPETSSKPREREPLRAVHFHVEVAARGEINMLTAIRGLGKAAMDELTFFESEALEASLAAASNHLNLRQDTPALAGAMRQSDADV